MVPRLPDTSFNFTVDGLHLGPPAIDQLLLDTQRQTMPLGGALLTPGSLEQELSAGQK